ncbi:hypothetical protein JXB27_03260 [Candidatus Woesearchaeota archaeon]|nr:hypothetical protein [Candidatus Woesearchaeota archaeon]
MTYQAEYTGLKELEPLEQTIVKGITEQYLPKLERDAHNDVNLLVHVKGYNKGGHRSKYSVHLKLIYATKVANVDNVYDWDLPKAVHEAFVALLNVLKKQFALDGNQYKFRKSENKNAESVKRRERYVQGNKRKMNARRRTKR